MKHREHVQIGMRRFSICAIILVLLSSGRVAAQNYDPTDWKPWLEYSQHEKDSLKNRWSRSLCDSIERALAEGHALPARMLVYTTYNEDSVMTDYKGYDLRGIRFHKHLRMEREHLTGVHLDGAELSNAEFTSTNLSHAFFVEAYLDSTKFKADTLNGIDFTSASLDEADFKEAVIENVNFTGAQLSDEIFTRATLNDAGFSGANLSDADFAQDTLDSPSFDNANLTGATFEGAYLHDASFFNSNLTAVVFTFAVAESADFQAANMTAAELWSADMRNSVFTQAILRGAVLTDAKLAGCNFFKAQFDSSSLSFIDIDSIRIRYAIWGNNYMIGEEHTFDTSGAALDAQIAEDTYRDLAGVYTREGLGGIASNFLYRENVMITKSSPWYLKIPRFLFLDLPYGYGFKPTRLFYYSLAVIFFFAFAFNIVTLWKTTNAGVYVVKPEAEGGPQLLGFEHGKVFLNCLHFSIISFTTFGYGGFQPRQWIEFFRLVPVEMEARGWMRMLVGVEAIFGIYVFALVVTSLLGK